MLSSNLAQAQGCNNSITATAPDDRYQDHGDGTVTDLHTGLMWQQCSVGQSGSDCAEGVAEQIRWDLVLEHSEALRSNDGFAGYADWYVPNRNELASLVEDACYGPAINVSVFPNTPSDAYWSSSPHANNEEGTYYVHFNYGSIDYNQRTYWHYVRLVRVVR